MSTASCIFCLASESYILSCFALKTTLWKTLNKSDRSWIKKKACSAIIVSHKQILLNEIFKHGNKNCTDWQYSLHHCGFHACMSELPCWLALYVSLQILQSCSLMPKTTECQTLKAQPEGFSKSVGGDPEYQQSLFVFSSCGLSSSGVYRSPVCSCSTCFPSVL